ncbi:isochorismatase family protein [Streptomyces sp. JJ36]|uniref:isochorismatase family protein n=1 Tax=Streptomyces sp. JJ36 TaxID=2736645 RepID=UPI001F290018|nr:isochorismatase family protein [Streptomyces sp. JJ36]MCF6524113.1 isochorismatase family protein [Streptomyces sp. JJ36]
MAGIPEIEPYPLPAPGDLPENTARWTVDPARAVLLVHDMQRYFLRPLPGTLRDELVRNAAGLREAAAAAGMPVAYTAQPGGMTPEERGLLRDFWGPGMTPEPADRRVVDPLAPRPGDWVFTKWRYSAFHRTDLLARLREAGRDQLVLCGVYAHVGVLMTACDAFSHDIRTFLVADAVADFSAADHRLAVEYAARRCAAVTTAKEIVTGLERGQR